MVLELLKSLLQRAGLSKQLLFTCRSSSTTTLLSSQKKKTTIHHHRSMCHSTIAGKATPAGTEQFVAAAKLPLYHKFNLSQLTINPLIHGPPRPTLKQQAINIDSLQFGDQLLIQAVHQKANCLYIYKHYVGNDSWAVSPTTLSTIMGGGKNRNSFVTVAGLGFATNRIQLLHRLDEALSKTSLECIDMAIIDCDSATFGGENSDFDLLNDSLEALESLCQEGRLQSYGLNISVPPYTHHTPPVRSSSALSMVPSYIESVLAEGQMSYADLVMYPISPSHAIPASYPMLDPSPDVYQSDEVSAEDTRTFTRGAVDPLLCFQGAQLARVVMPSDTADLKKKLAMMSKNGHNHGGSTINTNNIYLDPLDDPEIQAIIQDEEAAETLDNDPSASSSSSSSGSPLHPTGSKDFEMQRIQTLCMVPDAILLSPSIQEPMLGAQLDALCPPLCTTPRLQDKAIRAVLSVGVEVLVLDAACSAAMGGVLALKPSDLITSDQTDTLFGHFTVSNEESHLPSTSPPAYAGSA